MAIKKRNFENVFWAQPALKLPPIPGTCGPAAGPQGGMEPVRGGSGVGSGGTSVDPRSTLVLSNLVEVTARQGSAVGGRSELRMTGERAQCSGPRGRWPGSWQMLATRCSTAWSEWRLKSLGMFTSYHRQFFTWLTLNFH